MPTSNALQLQFGSDGLGKYPLTDTSTLQASEEDGPAVSPQWLADACVYVPGAGPGLRISRVTVAKALVTVTIGDGQDDALASGTAAVGDKQLVLTGLYGRPAGVMLPGEGLFGGLPEGDWTFDAGAMDLVPTCVVPLPDVAVSGFRMDDGQLVAGDVWLVGRKGVVLEPDVAGNRIKVHVVGDPLYKLRTCTTGPGGQGSEPVKPTPPLRKIKFVLVDQGNAVFNLVPDEFGGVTLTPGSNQVADNVLRVEPLDRGLRLRALGNVNIQAGVI